MRRRRQMAAAIAVLLATGAMTAPRALADTQQAEPSEWRSAECRYGALEPGTWAQREVVLTIACAVAKWPISGGLVKALAVARCESGLNAHASNGGSYLGVFQQAARYWPGRQNAYNPNGWDKPLGESAYNARSNVVVSIRMAHNTGWGDWSCA